MLPARRWKRSLQLGICKWDAMEALYRRQTKYLFADLSLLTSGEGDEATSPSFTAENEAIDASSSSLEAPIATRYMQGDAMETLYRRQTDTCLPIFKCLQAERATRQRRPLLQYVAPQLMLPARRWKRSLQLCCPRFALRKRPFSDGNQAPDCRRIVYYLQRWRAGNTAILRVDRHLQHVVVSAQLSLESRDAFPKDGNTHLPWRARGPFWRPPSGRLFPSLRFIYPSRSGYIRVAAPFWIRCQIRPFPRLS